MQNEIRSSRAQFYNLSDQSVAQEQNTCPLFVTEDKAAAQFDRLLLTETKKL
jgi:hypothetical protein